MFRLPTLASLAACCAGFTGCLFWDDTPTSPEATGAVEWRGSELLPPGIDGAVHFLQRILSAERRHFEANGYYGLDLQYRRIEVEGALRAEIGIPGKKGTEWLELRGALIGGGWVYQLRNWDRVADCFVFLGDEWYDSPAATEWREEFILNRGWSFPERQGEIVCGPIWVPPLDPITGLPMRWQKVPSKPEP